jgi:type VI secretion system secreted protein VgrG
MDAQLAGPVSMDTPLGQALTFRSMGGFEGLSQPFVYELEVFALRSDIEPEELLDKPVTVHFDPTGDESHRRHWNGRVVRFQYLATDDDGHSHYRLTLRPWLWQLTLSSDCRVFQNMTVPDIVTQVFQNRGFTDFETSLSETYPLREYVVQYREADFQFVSRLLEREGIHYFFRHSDGKHVLVLADSALAHSPAPGCESLPFASADEHRDSTMQYVRRWTANAQIETGAYSHADFDFTKPRVALYASRRSSDDAALAPADIGQYEHPGGFTSFADAETYARLRLDQVRRGTLGCTGDTNAGGLTVGATFALIEHPREDQNRKYLVVSARCSLHAAEVRSHRRSEVAPFGCSFASIDAKTTFRPPISTPRPTVRGPQTATVVGPAGKEIWTDEYGRIKVQFHWDRQGQHDEKSSCWVRVAQAWAGGSWGAVHVPRIGHEVIVDFLDGDPDRPIVTGSVYNGANMPPYNLPEHQTQSGIRTRSTPGGSEANANEIRFEDAIGEEDLYVQAERTQTTLVKASQSITIGTDRNLTVGASEKIAIGKGRMTDIAGGDVLSVAGSSTTSIGGDDTRKVTGLSITEIAGASTMNVLGVSSVNVGGSSTQQVAGKLTATVLGDAVHVTQGTRTTTVSRDDVGSVGTKLLMTVGVGGQTNAESNTYVWGTYRVGAKDTMTLESEKEVILRCGDTELHLTPKSLEMLGQAIHAVASKEVQLTGNGPSIRVGDDVQVTAKQLSLQSSGARLALSDTAKLTGSKVQLGGGSGASQSPSSTQDQTKSVDLTFVGPDHSPLANRKVLLDIAGQSSQGNTDGSGKITATVPEGATSATCTIWTGDFPEGSRVTYNVALASFDPATTIKGAQQRLKNLGYYSGEITGKMNYATRDALLVFQHAHDLSTTGLLDGATSDRLSRVHS